MSFLSSMEVAVARTEMQLSSWLMLAFSILILLGGLILCIRIAISVDRKKREAGKKIDDEGDA